MIPRTSSAALQIRDPTSVAVFACRWFMLVALISGCTSSTDPAVFADSTTAFEAGIAAEKAGNHGEVVNSLTTAIDLRGLSPDDFGVAIVKRAVAYARLKKFTEAHGDLDLAEQGAPNMDEVYQARHFVFSAQGKSSDASAALRKAKKINKSIKPIK